MNSIYQFQNTIHLVIILIIKYISNIQKINRYLENVGAYAFAKMTDLTKVVFEGQEFLPVKNVRTEHHEQGQYIWDAIFVDYFVDIVLDK